VLVDVLPGACASVEDTVGDHLHGSLEGQVLPVGAVRAPVLHGRDPSGAVHQLLACGSLRAEPAPRYRRVGVALDLHDAAGQIGLGLLRGLAGCRTAVADGTVLAYAGPDVIDYLAWSA